MTYTGLELFMEKLNKLIYMKDNPPISNHPLLLSERPQLQLLYEELGSMIQTLFVEKDKDLHELDEVKNLKKRFKDIAKEAHDIVDLFVSDILLRSKRLPRRSDDFEGTLSLENTMKSILSIKEEFISIHANMKMCSSAKTDILKIQWADVAGTSCTRNLLRSKTAWHEIIVGHDHDFELIRKKLVDDEKQLDVVSIVGMGGLGKTTFATKVFNYGYVVNHFHAWDDLKIFFPNDNTRSRLLVTSRLKEVAYHAKHDGLIHQLQHLTNEESWELLRKKVFNGNDCPKPLIEPGRQIAKNCHGLPLALVLIAGVLAKEAVCTDSWRRIARSVTSYIFSGNNWHMETLALSIDHLPSHLRECFLYLGGFQEDYKFRRRRLIWLWVAEGFIEDTINQSPEETAEDYLMELVDRNLVIVQDRKYNGAIKTFCVHDVLRELCVEIASRERFYLKIPEKPQGGFGPNEVVPYKKRRIFAYRSAPITNTSRIRSYMSFYNYKATSYRIIKFSHSWLLLMVLDLWHTKLDYVTEVLALLVHLRYLAIWYEGGFPSSICNLWSLQTLIIRRYTACEHLVLPNTISNLVNLRHLKCDTDILFPRTLQPMNLLTISRVIMVYEAKNFVKCVPNIKKLTCLVYQDMKYDFRSLTSLGTLKICWSYLDNNMHFNNIPRFQKSSIRFPSSLKKLTLKECQLPWSFMSEIQSLPQLEVLELLGGAFVGPQWDAGEEPFQQLKFLKLQDLDLKQWDASSINFPCLKHLMFSHCPFLKEIPLEIGYIPTLEHIIIDTCRISLVESVDTIGEYFDIKITVRLEGKDIHLNEYINDWFLPLLLTPRKPIDIR